MDDIRQLIEEDVLNYLCTAIQSEEYAWEAESTKIALMREAYALFENENPVRKIDDAVSKLRNPVSNDNGMLLEVIASMHANTEKDAKLICFKLEGEFDELYEFLYEQDQLIQTISHSVSFEEGLQKIFPKQQDYIDHRTRGIKAIFSYARAALEFALDMKPDKESSLSKAISDSIICTLEEVTERKYVRYLQEKTKSLYLWNPANN